MPKRIISKTSVTDREILTDLLNYTEQVGECNIWKGAVNSDGYAHMLGNVKVHRLVFKLHNPEIDINGLVVRHKCDNPLCIQPTHLLCGTHQDNMNDRNERDRVPKVITKDVVAKVKHMLDAQMFSQIEISRAIGIDPRRVSDINCGRYNDEARLTRYLK